MPARPEEQNFFINPLSAESYMDWTIEHIKSRHFVRVRITGQFTLAGHLKMIEDIISRDFWQLGMNVLFDNRELYYGETSVTMMRAARENQVRYDARIGDGKAALLMKSLPDFMRGRQYEILAEGKVSANIRIFTDEDEALAWLLTK